GLSVVWIWVLEREMNPNIAPTALAFAILTLAVLVWGQTHPAVRLYDSAGALLAKRATREHVGPLIEILGEGAVESAGPIREALTKLFTRLVAADAVRLSAKHRKILANELRSLSVYD